MRKSSMGGRQHWVMLVDKAQVQEEFLSEKEE